ncbi:uncharacterized protein PHACADRAFT_191517 [Phanerochaete carnosa HHB-10118-sp]|uniref:Uncharacterized protein n=1 Tax=Phanerochaete carnosa (strain HHB-10118-sp) TaxID=650164 RepID=K5V8P3_PHACS|nr:uncharacterized protein PHACADRAFT_191517 [Phanerochaete carnosa HHB-10118-sp]EKM59196.1 hypothetical protein PHACADRAFT_191517 [Phanerochaete carnosa HHB-10118-sp]
MKFNTRNAYYLRVSENTVLPLYLYLDEQHVEWMSERVLQHVLADLRPLVIPKLISEESAHLGLGGSGNAKKGTLDVHRGQTYQFGYFLRNTEPHSVLIKTRRFTAAPPREKKRAPQHISEDSENGPATNIHKRAKSTKKSQQYAPARKKRNTAKDRGKGKQRAIDLDNEEEAVSLSSDSDNKGEGAGFQPANLLPRRSARTRRLVAGGYREDDVEGDTEGAGAADVDIEMAAPENSDTVPPASDLRAPELDDAELVSMDPTDDIASPIEVKAEQTEPVLPSNPDEPIRVDEEPPQSPESPPHPEDAILVASDTEEDKPKPVMKLRYQGFSIRGRALCVIVEPYPPLHKAPRAMSLAPTGLVAPRAPSIAPADFVVSGQRARTPLFLPEDDRERSVTSAPWQRERPPVPLFHEDAPAAADDEDEDEADGGMLAFSQILKSVGDYATGAAEDDDEIEGAVFLGDADEAKGM